VVKLKAMMVVECNHWDN